MSNTLRTLQLLIILFVLNIGSAVAHEHSEKDVGSATYLGNEGVLIETEFGKVLFDPFFHNDYGSYTLVPDDVRKAIFSGLEPYDDISVIVVSHAHGDHFSAEDSLRYLEKNRETKLIGPAQAVDQIRQLEKAQSIEGQLVSVSLKLEDQAVTNVFGKIRIESLRIPHAGWPARKEVSNLVHRVTFGADLNIIHMGDADPNDLHFKAHQSLWEKAESELAFPPYWFFTSRQGPMILRERINTLESVGVHVPSNVPNDLKQTGEDYFSMPGERRTFSPE